MRARVATSWGRSPPPAAAKSCGWSGIRGRRRTNPRGDAGRLVRRRLAAAAGAERRGLVDVPPRSPYRFYRARRDALGPVGAALERMWDDALWRLKLAGRARGIPPRPAPRPRRRASTTEKAGRMMRSDTSARSHHRDRSAAATSSSGIFTDNARWAAWWGAGSTIDARPGGRMLDPLSQRHRSRPARSWRSLRPTRIVFTYGYVSGQPLPPGGSRVTIRLEADGARHAAASDARVRRSGGPRPSRARLALSAVALRERRRRRGPRATPPHSSTPGSTRGPKPDADGAASGRWPTIASPTVRMRDRFSCIEGVDELTDTSVRRSASCPACGCRPTGDDRATARAWSSPTGPRSDPTAQPRAPGTNVFVFGPDGRIESVTGFWAPMRRRIKAGGDSLARPSCRARRPTRSDRRLRGNVMENPDATRLHTSLDAACAQEPCRRDRAAKRRHRRVAIRRPVEDVQVQLARLARRPAPRQLRRERAGASCRRWPRR